VIPWRPLIAVLLAVAALGTIVRIANASALGRVAGVGAVVMLIVVALAVLREEQWAFGAAFFLGLCWFWAAIALRVQGVLAPAEIFLWLAWSVTVMIATVRGRAT
jgi:hypothetical protein